MGIALAGLLVLLFPVISASDDLHATRQEAEESSFSKRAVSHVAFQTDRVQNHFTAYPAQLTSGSAIPPNHEVFGCLFFGDVPSPRLLNLSICLGRAPPSFLPL